MFIQLRRQLACGLIVLSACLAPSAGADSGFSKTEVAILELTASKTPVVGEFLAPMVGILLAPEDEIDVLRRELKSYVDLKLLQQSHGLLQREVKEWQRNLARVELDLKSGRTSDAAAALRYIDNEIIGANATYIEHLVEAADDSYLTVYAGLAMLHMEILHQRALLEYDVWPPNERCEQFGRRYDESEPCSLWLRMGSINLDYYRQLDAEVARSLQRRVNEVSEWRQDDLGQINSDSGGSINMGFSPLYFIDQRLDRQIMESSPLLPKDANREVRRLRYVHTVENALKAFWDETIFVPRTAANKRMMQR